MKGFMHIVEIILVVILVFFVFVQFSYIPRIGSEWSEAKLSNMGHDVLSVLEEKGVNWFDDQDVRNELTEILPENVIYTLELSGVQKPRITVACIECSESQLDDLNEILDPGYTMINGRLIEFFVIDVEDISEAFALDNNVIVFFEKKTINENELRTYLRSGNGIVEIFDIEDSVVIDNIQETYFGLEWGTDIPNNNKITFSSASTLSANDNYQAYKWAKYNPILYDYFDEVDSEKWIEVGSPDVIDHGETPLALNLPSSICDSGSGIYSNEYDSFRYGEIDLDVSLESGGKLFIEFGGPYSAQVSRGEPHSFFMGGDPEGSNEELTIDDSQYHEVKISVEEGNFVLFVDGIEVARASGTTNPSGSGIGFYSRCADAIIDNLRITLNENHKFDNFLTVNEQIKQKDSDPEKTLLEQGDVKASLINYNIMDGSGRTVWISGIPTYTSENQAFIRSVIIWASGDTYKVIHRTIKNPRTSVIYKNSDLDMFEVISINLGLGYLY